MNIIDIDSEDWTSLPPRIPLSDTTGWTKERLNAENWVSGEVEILVSPDRQRFQYNGTEYWLELQETEQDEKPGDRFHFTCYKLRGNEWDADFELCTIGRFGEDRQWDALDDGLEGINRQHKDPLLAGALIVFMTV